MRIMKWCNRLILPTALLLMAVPLQSPAEEKAGPGLSGEITTKLFFFDYTGGVDRSQPHFLERYHYQDGWIGDNRSGAYLDMDLDLVYSDGRRDVFTLERRGEGGYNHAGRLRFNAEQLVFSAYYTHYRSATGGIDYLYNPDRVPGGTDPVSYLSTNTNSGYVGQFNNDSPDQFRYVIDRTTNGYGIGFKEALLGDGTSAALNYDGYTREGNKVVAYILGGGDLRVSDGAGGVSASTAYVYERWRAFEQPVNEKMDRASFNFTAAPWGLFQFAYEGSLEKFENQARAFRHSDIDFPFAANAGGLQNGDIYYAASALNWTRPLGFVPDSTLVTNAMRLSRSYDNTAWDIGYSLSILEQDTFTNPQVIRGYNTGKISNDIGYFTVNHRVLPQLSLEGHVRYLNRDNDSTYPVTDLISGEVGAGETLGVRINQIETWQYGLAANYRPAGMKTTFTPGWQHEDTTRDLTFHATGLIDTVSLYSEDTKSDELFLKMVSRPLQGLTVRLTPSYIRANRTGLVTEPEKSLQVKTQAGYAANAGMLVSGYYNYEKRENGNNTLTDRAVPNATHTQEIDNLMQSAGLSVHLTPVKQATTFVSLDWTQNAFEANYITSGGRRWDTGANAPVFLIRDQSEYDVDTYHLTVGGDWQAGAALRLNGSYIYTRSKGDVASGIVGAELASTIDGVIDNTLHSFILGADYALRKGLGVRTGYVYDYYSDKVYRDLDGNSLSGGVHTLMIGLAWQI